MGALVLVEAMVKKNMISISGYFYMMFVKDAVVIHARVCWVCWNTIVVGSWLITRSTFFRFSVHAITD